MLLPEEAAPRLAEDVVAVADPEVVDEVRELAHEELDRPEVGAALGQVRRLAVSELVVEDDGPAVVREIGEREEVVVRRARPAVQRDERRRPVRPELALHAIPGLVPVELGVALFHERNSTTAARNASPRCSKFSNWS